jgi:hypothetical protein
LPLTAKALPRPMRRPGRARGSPDSIAAVQALNRSSEAICSCVRQRRASAFWARSWAGGNTVAGNAAANAAIVTIRIDVPRRFASPAPRPEENCKVRTNFVKFRLYSSRGRVVPTLDSTLRATARLFAALFCTALLCGALAVAAATGTGADIIKKDDMLRGITTTRAQCAATARTIWLAVDGQDFCVRYYLSTAGGEGTRPVVFLQGDHFGTVNTKTWQWVPPDKDKNIGVTYDPSDRDIDTADLMKLADSFSRLAKTTAIYLARIGVDGTSGNHVFRKTLIEQHLINAALDAIKQAHGFDGFHLAGQSGGSVLLTALAGQRRDIGCAVAGSGRLGESHETGSRDPAHTPIDPLRAIPAIAQNRALRFMVVTDPADRNAPVKQQTAFVDKLRHAGRDVPQYFVAATDNYHHGVTTYAELVVAGCVLGRSDAEIATVAAIVAKRNAAYNELRRREIALFGKGDAAKFAGAQAAPAKTGVAARP